MYLHRGILRRALRVTFLEQPFSLRRWFWTLLFGALFVAVRTPVALARRLDRLVYPDFEAQPIREPVFIVGAPRSGTTFAQNLMSLDAERFSHVELYQTIFPSVVLQRALRAVAAPVPRRPLARLSDWIERSFFGAWRDVHLMQFTRPEEDEGFFVYTLMTESVYLLFPWFDALSEPGFPDRLPSAERRSFMRYYRRSLQRHLYTNGPDKTLLSKSTSFAGRAESMLEAFPDARIVHLVRHPYDCLPSHVSVFHPAWAVHSPEIARDSAESRAYAQLAVDWMRVLFEARHKFDEDRYVCVRYDQLVEDPAAAILGIYAHFGMAPSDAFRARLAAAAETSRGYESAHQYSLEEFGLSRAWVQERLGDVLDAYDFER